MKNDTEPKKPEPKKKPELFVTEAFDVFLKATKPTREGGKPDGKIVCPARCVPANADLIGRWGLGMETQANMLVDDGELVAGTVSTWSDGLMSWHNIRYPKGANAVPYWDDYKLRFPFEKYAEAFGCTGYDWMARCSRWWVYDFDSIVAHAKGAGISDEELAKIRDALEAVPWVMLRRSTGGLGLHVYVFAGPEGVPCQNHTEHAALARIILDMLSAIVKFDLSRYVDVVGGVAWIWHRTKMTPENGGLAIIKEHKATISVKDLPETWTTDLAKVKRVSNGKVRTRFDIHDANVDPFDRLASRTMVTPLEPAHTAHMDALKGMPGVTTIWNGDYHLLQTHTKAVERLKAEHPDLNILGDFTTISEGRNLSVPNCFLRPMPGGEWMVFRFSPGTKELDSWRQDGHGWTTTYFNHRPDLTVAAKQCGGMEDGDRVGEWCFTHTSQAQATFEALGEKLDLLDAMIGARDVRLKKAKDGRVNVEIQKMDDDGAIPGWLAKKTGKKETWTRIFDVSYRAKYDSIEAPFEAPAPRDDKPTIRLGSDLTRITQESIAALANDPTIYQRGSLVEISKPPALATGINTDRAATRLRCLPKPIILAKLSDNAYFQVQGLLGNWVDSKPDKDLVDILKDMLDFAGVRIITGVVSTPLLRPDGTIASAAGYDNQTGLYFDLEGEYPPIMPLDEAVALLKEVFHDFAFKSERDRGAAIVMLLSLFCRQAITGCCPFYLVDGNLSGTGKGLLTEVLIAIYQGCKATRKAWPTNDDEFRKLLTSELQAGATYTIFDNIKKKLDSAVFEKTLTTDRYSDRLLGGNTMLDMPMRIVFFGTGNNTTFDDDMIRRTVVCHLETALDRPDLRTDFIHPNLIGFVGEGEYEEGGEKKQGRRRDIVMACLSLVHAYMAAGKPVQKIKPWDVAFKGWSELIRSAAIWAGFEDCDSRDDLHEKANEDTEELDSLIEAMDEIGKPVTVAEAVKLAGKKVVEAGTYKFDEDQLPVVVAPKMAVILEGMDKKKSSHTLGNLFKRYNNRPRKGRKIVSEEGRRKSWLVANILPPNPQPPLTPTT